MLTMKQYKAAALKWRWQRYCRDNPYIDRHCEDAYAVFVALDRIGVNRRKRVS
jgi:hypothetical protein